MNECPQCEQLYSAIEKYEQDDVRYLEKLAKLKARISQLRADYYNVEHELHGQFAITIELCRIIQQLSAPVGYENRKSMEKARSDGLEFVKMVNESRDRRKLVGTHSKLHEDRVKHLKRIQRLEDAMDEAMCAIQDGSFDDAFDILYRERG